MRDIVRGPVKDKVAQGQDRSKREISSQEFWLLGDPDHDARTRSGRSSEHQSASPDGGRRHQRMVCAQPSFAHHLDEGRTGPVPEGAGPSALSGVKDPVQRLIEVLLDARRWRLTLWSCANEQRAMRRRIYARSQRDRDRSQWGMARNDAQRPLRRARHHRRRNDRRAPDSRSAA